MIFSVVILTMMHGGHAEALLKYPYAKVTIRVIDYDTGEPIEGARVRLKLSRIDPQYGSLTFTTEVYGMSDAEGMVILSGNTRPFVHYLAEHDGYYGGGGRFDFDLKESPLQFRHTPWNPTLTARLRKWGNKTAMYAARISGNEIPKLNEPIGFDLMEADWVAPYGNGKVRDFIFIVTKDYTDRDKYSGTLELTFSNKYDGIYAYPIDKNYHSGPPLPYFAPEEGYQDKLMKRIEKHPGKKQSFNYDRKQHFFFRVRSTEKDGKLESAMYGKLYGDIYFNAHTIVKKYKDTLPMISFEYYLNPDGTRNTEFKNDKNLIKKFNWKVERTYRP